MGKLFLLFALCISLFACGKKIDDDKQSRIYDSNGNYKSAISTIEGTPEIVFFKERNTCFAARYMSSAALVVVDCERAGMK